MRLLGLLVVGVSLAGSAAAQTAPAGSQSGDPLGYPAERRIGKPGDVEDDLNKSFPKRDSVLARLEPPLLPAFKKRLYDETGIKWATSYQTLAMWGSDVPIGNDVAAGGLLLLEAKWDAFRRGEDFQGGIVVSGFDSHVYGSASSPGTLFLQAGSLTANDALYVDVDWTFGALYWEQWGKKDRFVVRLGQHQPITVLDFFRYADTRTSFSSPALGFPASSIPFGPPGAGLSFKWWPREDSGLYVVGAVNDINSEIDELDWSPIFETGEVFAGLEVGYNWTRKGAKGPELDHVHVTFFYGDEASRKLFPSASGWGFKLAGEKQWGKIVGFGNYAYNTSKGGGFGFTAYKHAVNVGVAYNRPLGIRGEVAAAYTWIQTLDGGGCGFLPCRGESQSAMELYWKVLVTPDLWVTPGLQIAIDPQLNPNEDVVWFPMIKARVFF